MTPEEFDSLLRLLAPDRERAAERYEDIRRRLIRLFEWKGCESPEERTDETFNRVARNAAKPDFKLEKPDPYSYFCGVAYRVFQESLRDPFRRRTEIDVDIQYPPEPPEQDDERLDCLQRCLDRLPGEQGKLLLAFHAGEDRIRSRQKLARDLGITANALRIKVHRLKRQVADCLARCLEEGR